MLSKSGIAQKAISDTTLMYAVAQFKDRFYPSRKARYDLAKPGSFRFIPDVSKEKHLKEDYLKMAPMIFNTPPAWDEIMHQLMQLENLVNDSSTASDH